MAKSVKVTTSWNEDGYVEIESRGHKVISDVRAELGGTDRGLAPGELLIGSLGSCQLLVAQLNAKRFDIDIQNLAVELEAESVNDEHNGKSLFPTIKFSIRVESNSPEEKVKAFIEFVENHCPVGATLSSAVQLIQSELIVKRPEYH
ncbi:OsmC family protein [Paenibacillus sp. PR3]|uniref:OsmC family protein n=1 Tax=Paenibacillus terricola TaxID=2763503 RepID=A0ABR8MYT6_9BACL|nr:OsmC family protein [Paenibacillus terricola]MBD3921048.1 OsmC family protein [Paenibacillus terricola]